MSGGTSADAIRTRDQGGHFPGNNDVEATLQTLGAFKSGGSLPANGNGTYVQYPAMWPAHAPLPRVKDAVIQTLFQAGHGFTKTSGTGTFSDDTTVFQLGSQSVKIALAGDASGTSVRKTGMTAMDATGKYLAVTMMVDQPQNLQGLELYVSSDVFTNFSIAEMYRSAGIDLWFVPNRWQTILIPWGDFTVGGGAGATRSALTGFQIRAQDLGGGGTCNIWVNKIAAVSHPANGVLSFTFDDGYLSQFTKAKPYMDTYGFKGTFGPIINLMGAGAGPLAYMSLAQAQALYESGWDPAVHAYLDTVHNNYTSQTDAQVETDIQQAKAYMRANGLGPCDTLLVPQGHYVGSSRIDVFRRYFWAARSIYDKNHETFPPADKMILRVIALDSSSVVATVNAQIDDAITNNHWAILLCHNVADTNPGSGTYITTANFQSIVDHVNTSAINVKTISDVLKTGVTG